MEINIEVIKSNFFRNNCFAEEIELFFSFIIVEENYNVFNQYA